MQQLKLGLFCVYFTPSPIKEISPNFNFISSDASPYHANKGGEMSCDVLYLIIERFFLIVGDGDLDNGWNPGGCIVDLF